MKRINKTFLTHTAISNPIKISKPFYARLLLEVSQQEKR